MEKMTAIYLRVSREERKRDESESIKNQRNMLREFLRRNFEESDIVEYKDDGISGRSMEREGIKKLMEEKLNIDGLTLIQNNGDVQEVKHFHLHLKPYYNNGKSMSVEDVYNLLK